jgi:hypothetical protein
VLCAVEVPTVYPVSLPLDKFANNEWMGLIASDVLVRGTHWVIGCCVLYSLRVLSLVVVSVTLLTFLCPLYLLPFHSMFTLDLYPLCLIVFLAHPTLVALLHLCLSLTRQRGLYTPHIASHTESDLRRCANFSF